MKSKIDLLTWIDALEIRFNTEVDIHIEGSELFLDSFQFGLAKSLIEHTAFGSKEFNSLSPTIFKPAPLLLEEQYSPKNFDIFKQALFYFFKAHLFSFFLIHDVSPKTIEKINSKEHRNRPCWTIITGNPKVDSRRLFYNGICPECCELLSKNESFDLFHLRHFLNRVNELNELRKVFFSGTNSAPYYEGLFLKQLINSKG